MQHLSYIVCEDPAGMEDDSIKDGQIRASTYADILGTKHLPENARLNHGASWVAAPVGDPAPWLQVTLNQQQYITGVKTQGKGISWITTFNVEIDFVSVCDYNGGPKKVCGFLFQNSLMN